MCNYRNWINLKSTFPSLFCGIFERDNKKKEAVIAKLRTDSVSVLNKSTQHITRWPQLQLPRWFLGTDKHRVGVRRCYLTRNVHQFPVNSAGVTIVRLHHVGHEGPLVLLQVVTLNRVWWETTNRRCLGQHVNTSARTFKPQTSVNGSLCIVLCSELY